MGVSKSLTIYCLFILLFKLCNSKFSTANQEAKLVTFIQSKLTVHSPHENMMNSSVFPVLDLYQVVNVNENQEELTVKYVLSFYYYVQDVSWDPDEYNGVSKMAFNAGSFWTPEIVNEGIIDDIYTTSSYQIVFSDGRVVTSHHLSIFTYHCAMEYALFPFDEQKCPMYLSAWGSRDGEYTLALSLRELVYGQLSLAHLTQNPQWKVRSPVQYSIQQYPDGDQEFYDVLVVDLKLKRDPLFFLSVLIFPSFGVYILSSFVFILPVQSGEKITFASANLLAQVLTLGGEVATNLPRSSQHFPVFGNYMAFMIIHMASSLVLTILIYNIYFVGNNGREIPPWLDRILRDERLKYLLIPPIKTKHHNQSASRLNEYSRMENEPEQSSQAEPITARQQSPTNVSLGGDSETEGNPCETLQQTRLRDLGMMSSSQGSDQKKEKLAPLWARCSVMVDRTCFVFYLVIAIVVTLSYFISVVLVRSP